VADAVLYTSAFAGFRLMGRRPLAVLAWWLILPAGIAALLGLSVLIAFAGRPPLPSLLIHLSLLVGGPAIWLAATVLVCAIYRSELRPEQSGLTYLRLGADELRMAPLVVAFGLLIAAAAFPLVLSGPARLAAMLVLLLASPWLTLIGPALFAERRFDPKWRLVRGRYWDLLAMNLLTWGIYATLSVALGQAGKWLIVLDDAQIDRALHGGISALAPILAVGALLALLAYAGLLVIVAAPSAEAYRALTSPPAPSP
jgi:hypothetical protein